MIPASAYATGPDLYYNQPAVGPGLRATISDSHHDLESCIVTAAAAPLLVPGRAVFLLPALTTSSNKAVQPVYVVSEANGTSTVALFAGLLANDIWQTRAQVQTPHTQSYNSVPVIDPKSMQPRAVDGEWWAEVDVFTGIVPGAAVNVINAVGVKQGKLSAVTAGLTLPVGKAEFTGRTETVRGILCAAVRLKRVN